MTKFVLMNVFHINTFNPCFHQEISKSWYCYYFCLGERGPNLSNCLSWWCVLMAIRHHQYRGNRAETPLNLQRLPSTSDALLMAVGPLHRISIFRHTIYYLHTILRFCGRLSVVGICRVGNVVGLCTIFNSLWWVKYGELTTFTKNEQWFVKNTWTTTSVFELGHVGKGWLCWSIGFQMEMVDVGDRTRNEGLFIHAREKSTWSDLGV